MQTLRIILTGGGTGGHIVPAIAVADQLKQAGHTVAFIGNERGLEGDLVEDAGYKFYGIKAGKLRRYFSLLNMLDVFNVAIGFFQARSILAHFKPNVVFTKGGYVTVPVAYAAAFLEIPVVAHESDAVMGLANRLVAAKAKEICTGFPISYYGGDKVTKLRYTGNPLRSLIKTKDLTRDQIITKYGLTTRLPIVLFMGGSQGAHTINKFVFGMLPTVLDNWQIIHLTGVGDIAEAKKIKANVPAKQKKSYLPFSFVGNELIELLTMSDLVVSRASANALAELSYLGKPVILIPLPSAASDHQRANAKAYAAKKAALVLEEAELTPEKLAETTTHLIQNKGQLSELRRSIRLFSSPDADTLIAEAIIQAATA